LVSTTTLKLQQSDSPASLVVQHVTTFVPGGNRLPLGGTQTTARFVSHSS
jgi:hypothetical protein